ncbi:MAG: molybdenum cofactor biosynthesis protein MoaE [Pedosphaera sp.]|nr:molybdenum cofactor biosynthesis protein MoaE [Pedosphaera sp.]MSU40233.1 molybdenum cofactor biosynthesis protein MoaE [Pedosphaera sp.]
MHRLVTLTRDPIFDSAYISQRSMTPAMGAAMSFSGIVRGKENGETISAIDYEANEPMALHQFDLLFDLIEQRWPMIETVRVVHRLGSVPVGEPSVWIEVIAPHRAEAFAAGQFLIDEMKRTVPIWKKMVR